MTSGSDWRRELGRGFVIGVSNPAMRDRLLRSARSSLRGAQTLLGDSPSEATVLAENAARMAVVALAAHDGVRIDAPNKHAAAVVYARARPEAFDAATTNGLEFLRRTRNEAMYGDARSEWPAPLEVSATDATAAVELAQRVMSRVATLTARAIPPPPAAPR